MDNSLNTQPQQAPALQVPTQQPAEVSTPGIPVQNKNQNYNLVILDDNYIIRTVVKNEIYKVVSNEYPSVKFDVFSSDDGVGGLGYIYLTKPKIIIVDTTLPRYSGREIFEFLQTNQNYALDHTLVILVSEYNESFENLPPNFIVLDKSKFKFIDNLIDKVHNHALTSISDEQRNDSVGKKASLLAKTVVTLANLADNINSPRAFSKSPLTIIFKPISWVVWVFFEFLIAPLFVFYNISIGNLLGESQIKSSANDINFRSSKKPQFIKILVSISLTTVKLMLFLLINIIILLISREL